MELQSGFNKIHAANMNSEFHSILTKATTPEELDFCEKIRKSHHAAIMAAYKYLEQHDDAAMLDQVLRAENIKKLAARAARGALCYQTAARAAERA